MRFLLVCAWLLLANPACASSSDDAAATSYSVWDDVALCETGGNWHANTGNGYYGGVQFDYWSWISAGGGMYARYAHLATREQQIEVAWRWLGMTSWRNSWPACSRRLGLR